MAANVKNDPKMNLFFGKVHFPLHPFTGAGFRRFDPHFHTFIWGEAGIFFHVGFGSLEFLRMLVASKGTRGNGPTRVVRKVDSGVHYSPLK